MEGLKKKFILSENSYEFVQLLTRVVFAPAGDRPLNSFGWGMKVQVTFTHQLMKVSKLSCLVASLVLRKEGFEWIQME